MTGFFCTDLACRRGGRLVFADLSLRLEPGAAVLLIGPNGAGKSSLLRMLAGLTPPFAGQLGWDDLSIRDNPDEHRRRIAYLGHLDGVKPVLTAAETVAFRAALAGAPTDASMPSGTRPGSAASRHSDAAIAALHRIGNAHVADTAGRYLSAGQKRRVGLAQVLVRTARLWLLDEPTTALDRDGIALLETALAAHRAEGGMVVLATHQPVQMPEATTLNMADHAVAPEAGDPFLDLVPSASDADSW